MLCSLALHENGMRALLSCIVDVGCRTHRQRRGQSREVLGTLSDAGEARSGRRGWGGEVWDGARLGIMAASTALVATGKSSAACLVAGGACPKMAPAQAYGLLLR